MAQVSINVNVPADIFNALHETEDEFKKEMTLSTAIRLYQHNKLSLAKAADLAGYHRYDFEKILFDNNIPINFLSANDILKDVEKM